LTDRLKNLSSNPDYQQMSQLAVDDYSIRYNHIPSESDLSRLRNPHNFDLETYCINSLINGLKRYFDEQVDEIEFLKSSSSKDKRISKMSHNILLIKNYLQIKFSKSKSYQKGFEEIEKIVTKTKIIHGTIGS
jgi:hypothetical protein